MGGLAPWELCRHLNEAADLGLSKDTLRLLLRLRKLRLEEAQNELRVLLQAAFDLALLDEAALDDMVAELVPGAACPTLDERPEPPEPLDLVGRPKKPHRKKPNGHDVPVLEEEAAL